MRYLIANLCLATLALAGCNSSGSGSQNAAPTADNSGPVEEVAVVVPPKAARLVTEWLGHSVTYEHAVGHGARCNYVVKNTGDLATYARITVSFAWRDHLGFESVKSAEINFTLLGNSQYDGTYFINNSIGNAVGFDYITSVTVNAVEVVPGPVDAQWSPLVKLVANGNG